MHLVFQGIQFLGGMNNVGCLHLGAIARNVTGGALKVVVSAMRQLQSLWLQSDGPIGDSTRLEEDFLQVTTTATTALVLCSSQYRGAKTIFLQIVH